jgi:subtilisin-like proprotein convertase family protein
MGIWKQRIEGSWVRCNGGQNFSIANLNGSPKEKVVTAISLKHKSIDLALTGNTGIEAYESSPGFKNLSDLGGVIDNSYSGFIYDNIGGSGVTGEFSYIIDYYYDSITSTKSFSSKKNYQFKTHVLNYAYIKRPTSTTYKKISSSFYTTDPDPLTIKQNNGNVYYSNLNIFKGALGINPSWEDLCMFDVPFYKGEINLARGNEIPGSHLLSEDGNFYLQSLSMPTTYTLFYYSSPKNDVNSGFVSFTNKLRASRQEDGVTTKKIGTQSVLQAGYGISGVEINEIGWKLQGYSFVAYDNKPDIGIKSVGITSSYSYYDNNVAKRAPLKKCVLGKGWYYDEDNNEYTWYDRIYNDSDMDSKNNPVGGAAGSQDTNIGYRENNYIAKYIPFQKFNLSFLYENIRTDSGIKIYLSPTLPTSKPIESSKYVGKLEYPSKYVEGNSKLYRYARALGVQFSLVSSSAQDNYPLSLKGGTTQSIPKNTSSIKNNWYSPISKLNTDYRLTYALFYGISQGEHDSYRNEPTGIGSSIIQDNNSNNPYIVNSIFVEDDSTNLKEIKVNITLRHTYIADMIINLKVPNGNVINIKAKYSGDFFNDLRDITFTTNTDIPSMQDFSRKKSPLIDWWPNEQSPGFLEDPIGLAGTPAYPLKAPWLSGFGKGEYNFNWAQVKIRDGLTFQMDKNNGQGRNGYRSNVNDLKYLSNVDSTFNGTYSLYIKDDWGGDSGMLESWSIEFIYKKVFTPILSLTQSDPNNAINKGAPKLQYLFGLEGNQYLFIKGDVVPKKDDPNISFKKAGTNDSVNLSYLLASLKNLKIDGGYHDANNKLYQTNDSKFSSSDEPGTFEILSNINNIAYSSYVGSGNVNDPNKLSISSVTSKIGNGSFKSGIWENGVWNSGWRNDSTMKEFHAIDDFFTYDRGKKWRFSIFGSADSAASFSIGDKVSIGNLVLIDINEERKLIKSVFTIIGKGIDYITVEFETDFPIRRIKLDSESHRLYITKNIWLAGGFFNGYFKGVWNSGLFQGFPYITEMHDSHWISGAFKGGRFKANKKSLSFTSTYMTVTDRMKVGLLFNEPHKLAVGDVIYISSSVFNSSSTKIVKIESDYKVVTDINWDDSKINASGTISTNISTGLVQSMDLETNNVSTITSLQSMDSTRVFMYNSWIDVNFDTESAVNIGKPQSTIDVTISNYSYSENNLFGYPTYDVLSSNVTFRDSFSTTIRNYRLGSKYKVYEDYIGSAGDFDEYFDATGWSTRPKMYRSNTFPFFSYKTVGSTLPESNEFSEQGWVLNRITSTGSAIMAERTTEAEDDEDVAAGKELKLEAVGKGGTLNIKPATNVTHRNNNPIEKQRYTIIKFDMLSILAPDNIFEESDTSYDINSKYQPIIHFNNLNIVTRKIFVPLVGYKQMKLDATYLPIYKNVNHVTTSKTTKIEFFYNRRNLSLFLRGNGLDGENVTSAVIDNMRFYEVDMIPFFQYFTPTNINKSVSIPYQGLAPAVPYTENDFNTIDQILYSSDSIFIFQKGSTVKIQSESAAVAAESAASNDPEVAQSQNSNSNDEYPVYVDPNSNPGWSGPGSFDPFGT